MKKISIIVPVYNVEDYLAKCIDSLVNQTLEDIEIILIDDNSTDNSKKIMQKYYEKNIEKIVLVFLEKNMKQGFVRNEGVKIATGEYIAFVDSDDYIDSQMCEILYKKAKEKDYDLVCFDMIDVVEGNEKLNKLQYNYEINGDIDYSKRDLLVNSKGYFTTRIYKRNMLISNNIKFPVGIFYEDSPFNTLSLLYAKSIAKVDKGLYYYLKRDGSSSNCMNQERLYHRIDTVEYMIEQVKNRQIYKEYKPIIDDKFLKMSVGNIHLCLDMFDKPNKIKLKQISENINKNMNDYLNNKTYKELDKISKLYLIVNDYSPTLLIGLDKIYKFTIKLFKK